MPAPDVAGYAVERLLGAGAHCEVWLAREDVGLRRPVALKVFRGPAGRDGYARELAMVRRVEEVRRRERAVELVQALDSGERADLAFIAFEWLEGGSLMDLVEREGPLPTGRALDLVRQVGRALALLHGEGVFHRDVKPGNVLLGQDGRARLADFGLSRPLEGTLSAAGSPAFAAPEVIAGRASDGRLLDVYSLGATLAYLLSGQTMLPGRPDVFAMERQGVPRPLQRAIVAACAGDPADRTRTIDDVLALLSPEPRGPSHDAPPPAPSVSEGPGGARPASPRRGDTPHRRSTPPSRPPEPEPPAQSPELDPRARRAAAREVVDKCAYAAAAVTLLPIPGSELVAVMPIQLGMVIRIGQLHGVELSRDSAAELVAKIGAAVGLSVLGTRVVTTAVKLVLPGAGAVVSAPFIYASTVGIGAVVRAYFERGGDLSKGEIRSLYQESLTRGKREFDPRRIRSEEAQAMARDAAASEEELPAVLEAAAEAPESAESAPAELAEDPAALLERLEGLRARGILDDGEYRSVRRRIIERL